MERSDRNVLQGTFVFSFQLLFRSTVTFRLQRWSSRGHILKSLASKLQVLENCRPWLEDSSIFGIVKILYIVFCRKICFFGDFLICFLRSPKKILDLFFKTHEKKF